MNDKKVVLTRDGLLKLEAELTDLKLVRRKDVAEKIKEARGQGDLSENAEYDSAKEEQAEIEARIATVEKMLRNADVIDEDDYDKNTINLGSTVKLFDVEFDEEVVYSIVGSVEADPTAGKISNESLLGINLIGKKVGDEVEYDSLNGVEKFKVLEISM